MRLRHIEQSWRLPNRLIERNNPSCTVHSFPLIEWADPYFLYACLHRTQPFGKYSLCSRSSTPAAKMIQ